MTTSVVLLKRRSDAAEDGGMERYLQARSAKQGHSGSSLSNRSKG